MNTELIKHRFTGLVENGLPVEYVYEDATYTAAATTVFQKLKFSEWGVENGYEQSIMAKCDDFTGGAPKTDGIIEIDGVEKRILSVVADSANAGVRIDLGAKYPA